MTGPLNSTSPRQARERRVLCADLEPLVARRPGLVNAVREWSRPHGVRIPTGTMARFCRPSPCRRPAWDPVGVRHRSPLVQRAIG